MNSRATRPTTAAVDSAADWAGLDVDPACWPPPASAEPVKRCAGDRAGPAGRHPGQRAGPGAVRRDRRRSRRERRRATVELVRVKTEGDVNTGPLAAIGGTGIFVTAVRPRWLDGRVDVIVHSFKDLPTAAAPGPGAGRGAAAGGPVGRAVRHGTVTPWPPCRAGARVGTGSPRRAAQLLRHRRICGCEPVRGNVDTRLRMVSDGDLDAVVLAAAGLARLGRTGARSPNPSVPT